MIEFQNGSFSYEKGRPVIKNLPLSLSDSRDFGMKTRQEKQIMAASPSGSVIDSMKKADEFQ